MNIGFFLSLVAGLVWSIGNTIDKISVSKFVRSPVVLTMIYSITSFSLGLAALFFTQTTPVGLDWWRFLGVSFFYTLGTLLYFNAMQHDEPSRVVPLFSLTIPFLALLSAIFLGEILTVTKYIGILLVAAGSFIITSRAHVSGAFKSRAFGLMAMGAFSFSIAYVLMRKLLFTYSFWDVFAFQRLGTGLISIPLFVAFYPKIKEVLGSIKKRYLALSFSSELLNEGGAFLFVIASSVWLVTLVETAVSVQYLFIFLWGFIISRVKPLLFKEEINRGIVLQKIVSVMLMIIGIYLIS